MRFKLCTFFALLAIILLSASAFADSGVKGPVANYMTKSGMTVGIDVQHPSNLPPVGPRNGNPLDEIIISEDFETVPAGTLPEGWIQIDEDGGFNTPFFDDNSTWRVIDDGGYPAHSGSRIAVCFYNDGALPNDDWMILPQQTLTGQITLTFWKASQDGDYLESYEVRVSTSGTEPADFTELILDENDAPAEWQEVVLDLSAYSGTPFYIAFHYDAIDEFVFKLDDVLLEATDVGSVGSIGGTVTDVANSDPVEGVFVEILATELSAMTGADGTYLIPNVPAGTYAVNFSKPFWMSEIAPGQIVEEGATTTVDMVMTALSVGETTYMSTAGPVNIIDHDTVSMDLTVDESHTILDLDVTLNITHTYVSDMSFWLDAPDGTRIQLVQGATGFPTGANFVDTRFDDEADADFAYSSGMSNYTGSWRPLGNLSDFDGLDVQGTWTLVALDNQDADQGMINDFSLTVTHDVDDAAGDNPGVPASIVFHGSYPNPFNPSTMLSFELSGLAHVQLQVFNSLGQQVATLIDGVKQAGQHSVEFDASALSSGIYFARFSAGDFVSTKKMVLMR